MMAESLGGNSALGSAITHNTHTNTLNTLYIRFFSGPCSYFAIEELLDFPTSLGGFHSHLYLQSGLSSELY